MDDVSLIKTRVRFDGLQSRGTLKNVMGKSIVVVTFSATENLPTLGSNASIGISQRGAYTCVEEMLGARAQCIPSPVVDRKRVMSVACSWISPSREVSAPIPPTKID